MIRVAFIIGDYPPEERRLREEVAKSFSTPEIEVGIVSVNLHNDGQQCLIEIRDNGSGLREGFSLDTPTSLGLSIVRDLVRAQLHGVIEMKTVDHSEGGGTLVTMKVPSRIS